MVTELAEKVMEIYKVREIDRAYIMTWGDGSQKGFLNFLIPFLRGEKQALEDKDNRAVAIDTIKADLERPEYREHAKNLEYVIARLEQH